MHYIEVEDLRFSYNEEPVLNNISFTVDPGEFVILTGENGAAKTTLLKNILGLLEPEKGQCRIAQKNFQGEKLQVGYVPQSISSFNAGFPSTVYEFVQSGRYQQNRWFKRLDQEDEDHIRRAFDSVGMWEQRNERIGDLSGGQKQRICLARVFATDPDLFILDEPTTGMDIESRKNFYDLLRHNTRNHGKAILMVTHEDLSLKDYFDKQIHLVREEGTPWRCFSMTSCKEPSSLA
ncbi:MULTISPECIES: metal ABC transporter ATP-binding protein [Aerococcus]|uniref:Metal ABC transporter ATP-binding protein n=1 Tax=Aerococcus sanguinicola TaxID=119206 RepID=A0A5N1GQI2_9LACT|nr:MULTISPECIES: metal ABC transporter ATP-binding protein [Aerococcus]KAA9302311.1 metal ABC transporter ATP-binding protein [Aerococcus sanguinicola]MDK6369065.1 metal ABC transporter ATP-binding protein [Aerococcus sp. UMB9870]MDK6678967.1 metal ABC transporter ATP-binding protein [Aerococcus sp. UMB8608]MDK6686558.1 metal ABC transporter ATP-binding protein [Aerococcus sp. UMB8623]MDK6939626.1 metal ABC transporter ATP-binding protein [Aerococcus sp. UMB8487]